MRFKNNCSSSEAPVPERGNRCFSAGIQWPTRAAEAVKGTSKRRSGNSWRRKIRRVNRKRRLRPAARVRTLAPLTQTRSCSEGRWGEVHQSGRRARRETGWRSRASRRSQKKASRERSWLTCDTTGRQKPNGGFAERKSWRIRSRTKSKQSVGGRRTRTRRRFNSKSFKYSCEHMDVTDESEWRDSSIISCLAKALKRALRGQIHCFLLCFCVFGPSLKASSQPTRRRTSNYPFDLQLSTVSSAQLFRHKWLLPLQLSITAALSSRNCNEPGCDGSPFSVFWSNAVVLVVATVSSLDRRHQKMAS